MLTQVVRRTTTTTTTITACSTRFLQHKIQAASSSSAATTAVPLRCLSVTSSSSSSLPHQLHHRSLHSTSSRPLLSEQSTQVELTEPLINSYADRRARPVSLQAMIAMGSRPEYLLTAAQWLHAELPVRLAKRLRDLEDLPFGLSKTNEVQSLMNLYRTSLSEALSMKSPHSSTDELVFTEMIKRILMRHQQVVVDLAAGINGGFIRSRQSSTKHARSHHFLLQEFLDRFNSARIGLRMLMAQHVALHNPPDSTAGKKMVGCIEIGCNPSSIIAEAINDAADACRRSFGYTCVPIVNIQDVSAKNGGIRNFNYVAAHLKFMIFELLKNAMRATVEHARRKKAMANGWKGGEGEPVPKVELTDADLPPISVVVVDGPTDVTIKISDRGGGIKRSELPLVFTYTYSATQKSMSNKEQAVAKVNSNAEGVPASDPASLLITPVPCPPSSSTPLQSAAASSSSAFSPTLTADWQTGANYAPCVNTQLHDFVEAFGLPICRLYARHLGGDLQLYSLNGHGTDAYLYINRLGDFEEVIQD